MAAMIATWHDEPSEEAYVAHGFTVEPFTADIICLSCTDDAQAKRCCDFPALSHKACEENVLDEYGRREELALTASTSDMRGCALLDSGASTGLAPDTALNYLMEECPEMIDKNSLDMNPKVSGIMVGDGKFVRPQSNVALNACAHTVLPKDSQYRVNVLTEPKGNRAPIIIGMDFLREHKVIVDFELGKMWYKNDPTVIYTLKRAPNGLLFFPLSKAEADKHLKVEHNYDMNYAAVTDTVVNNNDC